MRCDWGYEAHPEKDEEDWKCGRDMDDPCLAVGRYCGFIDLDRGSQR
jgi:hypothetical protein